MIMHVKVGVAEEGESCVMVGRICKRDGRVATENSLDNVNNNINKKRTKVTR